MIKLVMGTEIQAERASVWEALSDPQQIANWRPGVIAPRTPEASYPTAGRRFRWSCRLHELPVELVETPVQVQPPSRLESDVALGLFHFSQTFTLSRSSENRPGTRLVMHVATDNQMPLVGGCLDRFAVRRFATDLASTYLQAVRDWCERGEATQRPLPTLMRSVASSAHL
ncbi:MAG: SRPBCC family protein [bacterium]|nr:SRPBCC family protein [bacterium]MCP5069940.1 SRPBCC family protein [bacterium]